MGVPAFAPDTPMLPACQIARSFQQENNRSLPPASDAARCSATLPLPPYRLRTACYDRKRYKFAHHSTPNNKKSLSAFILLRFPLKINIPLIVVYDLYTVFAVNYPQGGDAMYYSEFGENLKKLRTARDLTQQELGAKVGLSKAVVSKCENGLGYPTFDVLIRIAAYFGVTTDYLLGVTGGKTIDVSELSDSQIDTLHRIITEFKKVGKE